MEKAIGLRKTKVGWQVVTYQISDGKVVKEEKSEPDVRALALERFYRTMSEFWQEVIS